MTQEESTFKVGDKVLQHTESQFREHNFVGVQTVAEIKPVNQVRFENSTIVNDARRFTKVGETEESEFYVLVEDNGYTGHKVYKRSSDLLLPYKTLDEAKQAVRTKFDSVGNTTLTLVISEVRKRYIKESSPYLVREIK